MSMSKAIAGLGVIFGLAFVGLAVLQFLDLQSDLTGASNELGTLADNLPIIFIVLAAFIFVVAVGAVVKKVIDG